MKPSLPRVAGRLLVVVFAVLLAVSGTLAYVRAEIVDGHAFGRRLVSALDDSAVRGVVTDRVVDALVNASSGDLITVRPLAEGAVGSVIASPPFRRVAARAAADAHREVVDGDASLLIELTRGAPLFADALRALGPDAAAATPADTRPSVGELNADDPALRAVRRLADVARWWWLFFAAALAAGAGAILVSTERRRTVGHLGAGVAGAGALVAAAVTVAGAAVTARLGTAAGLDHDAAQDAVAGVWKALFGDLRTAALLVGAGGVLVAAVATGLVNPLPPVDRLLTWARGLRVPAWARAALLLVGGTACLVWPRQVAEVLVVAGGAVALYLGASELGAALPERAAPGRRSVRRGLLLGGALVTALAAGTAAAVIALTPPALPKILASQRAGDGCNGSPKLCDRRLNEVVFAGTHNSFAAGDEPGWLFANQRLGIARQLRDGIRALLIDVHHGVRDERTGNVRTDLEGDGTSRNKIAEQLSPEALKSADRIAGRVGAGSLEGTRAPYLCHGLCELGSEPLDQELTVIRRFLDANPREVLVVVVEDYVAPAEIERSMRRTGLLPYAAALDRSAPLPTLGELVSSGKRLVVFAENKGGTPPWYMPAFSYIQDTPLGATKPDELRCTRSRGHADSPILLLNHWIDRFPPRPSDHEPINRAAFLRGRIDRCAKKRGLGPGIVAVDFYERGDVVKVARELNEAR